MGSVRRSLKTLLLGLPGFQPACRRLTRRHVRAVMYHRFSPAGQDHPRRLPAAELDWQLAHVARHHRAWTPDRQLDAGDGPTDGGAPPVVVTVDDGYADFARVAAPLLQRHRIPATIFVTTDFVAGRSWFWWDRLMWLLENAPAGRRELACAGAAAVGDPSREDDRWRLWHTLADRLSTIDDAVKEDAMAELAAALGCAVPAAPPEDYAALTWAEVADLAAAGFVIGAHTVSHPVLSRVPAARAEHEIAASRRAVAEHTGTPPDWFCYPQGGPADFDPGITALVRAAGFRGCYQAYPDAAHDGDPHRLPRYSLDGDRTAFLWIMCGAEYLFERAKARLRGR